MMDNLNGRIPADILNAMEIEFAAVVPEQDQHSQHFHAAMENYRRHRDGKLEPRYRKEISSFYVDAVPHDPLDPSRVLSTIHRRAIEKCAQGGGYREERPRSSPFEILQLHRKKLRVYVRNGTTCWKILKLWASKDGSFHSINHIDHLLNPGKFHHTSHPSGAVHSTDRTGHKRYSKPYWPDFGEMDFVPVEGCGLYPKDFYASNPPLVCLESRTTPSSGLILNVPSPDFSRIRKSSQLNVV